MPLRHGTPQGFVETFRACEEGAPATNLPAGGAHFLPMEDPGSGVGHLEGPRLAPPPPHAPYTVICTPFFFLPFAPWTTYSSGLSTDRPDWNRGTAATLPVCMCPNMLCCAADHCHIPVLTCFFSRYCNPPCRFLAPIWEEPLVHPSCCSQFEQYVALPADEANNGLSLFLSLLPPLLTQHLCHALPAHTDGRFSHSAVDHLLHWSPGESSHISRYGGEVGRPC